MNKIIINTGLWSAIICLTSFVIWIISFAGIAITSPLFYWTNLEDYIDFVNNNSQFFQYLAKSFMILFAIGYMILAIVYSDFANMERKILAKIAITFSLLFTLLVSAHYYVQISAIRFAFDKEQFTGLEHFLQSNPTSFICSLNMLGWTVFLGLSSLFMYLALKPDSLTKTIRAGLFINTISCILGGAGYLFQIDIITFITMNLGIGCAFFIMTISSIRYFSRLRKEMN